MLMCSDYESVTNTFRSLCIAVDKITHKSGFQLKNKYCFCERVKYPLKCVYTIKKQVSEQINPVKQEQANTVCMYECVEYLLIRVCTALCSCEICVRINKSC